MKRILLWILLVIALGVAAFAVVKDSKTLRLVTSTPSENITGVMATVTCDGNSVLVMPEKGTHNSEVRMVGNWDFTDYKAISFTLENLDSKPLRMTFRMTNSDQHFETSRRSFQGTVGDLYYLAPYEAYVRSALEHPNIVGTHWHQFSDQATTGRFDGENFNVGFTDVCDTPYYEMVEAIRNVG